jgi:AmmeMemoRadiSam system protein A
MPVSSYINSSTKLTTEEQSELKKLALLVITNAVKQHQYILPVAPTTKALQQVAANFVTLYKESHLNGCIGCFIGKQPLWQSVCEHAYSSAFEDHRFLPLKEADLKELRVELSILSDLVAIENKGEHALIKNLTPNVDGLLLKEPTSGRSAIFLPSVWHSLPTAELFLQALKQKGGWSSDYWSENIELCRFHTQVF